MKAIILCAGEGKRLRPLTWFTPKPMLKVADKPVLEHLVNYLYFYGVNDIAVNLHHLPDKIYKHFGTRLMYSYEKSLLGEEGTIRSMQAWRNNEFTVVINGDTLTNLDLRQMIRYSDGRNVRFMDNGVYAGVRLIRPDYYEGQSEIQFRGSYPWYDIGTFEGLKKARKEFKLKLKILSDDDTIFS